LIEKKVYSVHDDSTTISDLKKLAISFRDERDWAQYHLPKNLAVSIVLEAAELLEHFQWLKDGEVEEYLSGEARDAVTEEICDVMVYLLTMANDLGIDVASSVQAKIKKNAEKYPVEN
jgi:dCTP diphosphatase